MPRQQQPRQEQQQQQPISEAVLQARFVSILPIIQSAARHLFRDRPRSHREEYICETVAYAWRSFVRLARRGKDARRFPYKFAQLNAMAVRNGRRIAGGYNGSDLTTVPAEQSGCHLECLHASGAAGTKKSWEELLVDSRGYTPADAACTRIDYAAWRASLSQRDRQIADALSEGERAAAVADRFQLSPGRISQLRAAFEESWLRFQEGGSSAQEEP